MRMGLIDEIFHVVVAFYRAAAQPAGMARALDWLKERLGAQRGGAARCCGLPLTFHPWQFTGENLTLEDYYAGTTEGVPNEQILLEEMLMLWLENKNPAFGSYQELFDDAHLQTESAYPHVMAELYRFFETQPHFGLDDENVVDLLTQPGNRGSSLPVWSAGIHPRSLGGSVGQLL